MLKFVGQAVGVAFSLLLRVRFALLRRVLDDDRALSMASEFAGRWPGLFGLYVRQAFYRRVLQGCGNEIHFGYQTLLSKADAQIGDRVYFGRFCTVGRVSIGAETRVADGVQLLSGRHHHGTSAGGVAQDTVTLDRITIGQGVWIGANAVVMADVGDGAIIGAGAVVTRPVKAGETVVGVPARPIKTDPQSKPRRVA